MTSINGKVYSTTVLCPHYETVLSTYIASELRSWLFFYSLPVLNGVLPLIYFKHYAQLVFAVYFLSQSSITREELEYAKEMLQNFYSKYEDLYGKSSHNINLVDMYNVFNINM